MFFFLGGGYCTTKIPMGFWGFWGSQRWKIHGFFGPSRYHVVTSLPESSEAEQQLLLQICQQLVFGMLQVGGLGRGVDPMGKT